ncbi:MAG: radical SAM protein [Hyphomicrobiales bacterium]|nr:radical SAM protein [Hyphomicrobiales bacterium]
MSCCERRLKLADTESVCPVCLETIPAERWAIGDEVRLIKTCPEHGRFSVPVWRGFASYGPWGEAARAHSRTPSPATAVDRGCPHDCGLCPDHRQQSCCVLLEVTSRCDLACPVCFASADRHGRDLPLDEIERRLDALAAGGGRVHVQLSGGEPTVRDDLPEIVRLVRRRGFDFVQLNTNGVRLALEPDYVAALAAAGVDCVFLQFDGVDDEVHRRLRGAKLARLKDLAIERCGEVGLGVVLAPTIAPGVNDGQIGAIVDHAIARMPTVRAVHFQPISYFGRRPLEPTDADRFTLPEVMAALIRHSRGTIALQDFHPGSAENPYCSFSGRFTVDDVGGLHPTGAKPSCCGVPDDLERPARAEAVGGCCGDAPPAAPIECCGSTRPSPDVDRARRYVAGQWRQAASGGDGEAADAFDRFLATRERTLGLSGMAFQDAWTLDLDRLRQCHIHVVEPDARMIPFCAFNLTDRDGRSLYRASTISAEAVAG